VQKCISHNSFHIQSLLFVYPSIESSFLLSHTIICNDRLLTFVSEGRATRRGIRVFEEKRCILEVRFLLSKVFFSCFLPLFGVFNTPIGLSIVMVVIVGYFLVKTFKHLFSIFKNIFLKEPDL